MCRKLGTIRGNQHSCINRVARETKTAGTLAVVVGGFVACWLPFFILYLATPFVPVEPSDILMPALTWLGRWRDGRSLGTLRPRTPRQIWESIWLSDKIWPQTVSVTAISFSHNFPSKRHFSIKIVLSDKRLSEMMKRENEERRKNGTVRAESGGE